MSPPDEPGAGTRVVFGIRPVEELCRARPRDVSVVYVAEGQRSQELEQALNVARDRGIAVELRPRRLVAALAGAGVHQGVVAVAGAYRYAELHQVLAAAEAAGEAPLLLLLDGITDPHNLGALVRSAEVLGAHGVIIPDRDAAPVTPAAVKASAGATERVKVVRIGNLLRTIDSLRERGLRVYGGGAELGGDPQLAGQGEGRGRGEVPREEPHGSERETPEPGGPPVNSRLDRLDLRGPVGLVIGAEGRGMRQAVARRCDGAFHIPQRGAVSSLNASVAGAIALYEAARQRLG